MCPSAERVNPTGWSESPIERRVKLTPSLLGHIFNTSFECVCTISSTSGRVYGGQKINGQSLYCFNPLSTGTHFYHEFWMSLGDSIDISKGLWRSRLMARVWTILIPTRVSEAVENRNIIWRMNIKTHPSTERLVLFYCSLSFIHSSI